MTSSTSLPTLEILEVKGIGSWSWNVTQETCAICRNNVMDHCIDCLASVTNESDTLQRTCSLIQGTCQHIFHRHCLERWLLTRQVCPLCNSEWHELKDSE